MADLIPIATAAAIGFGSGFGLAIPVGPINLTIINEGARKGFKWAILIALGATTMEMIYCSIAFTGLASFFSRGYVKATMELTSFVFLLFLGIKFLMVKSIEATNKFEEKIETRLHPHSAFMTGFVRVMGNPAILLFWIVCAANFISRDFIDSTLQSKAACVVGVALGANCWFVGLSYAVSYRKKKFKESTLIMLERCSGVGLLIVAAFNGVSIIWQMVHHRM